MVEIEPRDRNGRTRREHAEWLDSRARETLRIARAMPDMRSITTELPFQWAERKPAASSLPQWHDDDLETA